MEPNPIIKLQYVPNANGIKFHVILIIKICSFFPSMAKEDGNLSLSQNPFFIPLPLAIIKLIHRYQRRTQNKFTILNQMMEAKKRWTNDESLGVDIRRLIYGLNRFERNQKSSRITQAFRFYFPSF